MSFIENKGGAMLPDDILSKIFSFNGLFRKIFGDLHDNIVFDDEAEHCRRMLREIYLFKDSDDLFPKVLHKRRYFSTLETVFRFAAIQSENERQAK